MSYYIYKNETQTGPFPEDALQAQVASGTLLAEDLVWADGLSAWTPAGEALPALFAPAEDETAAEEAVQEAPPAPQDAPPKSTVKSIQPAIGVKGPMPKPNAPKSPLPKAMDAAPVAAAPSGKSSRKKLLLLLAVLVLLAAVGLTTWLLLS